MKSYPAPMRPCGLIARYCSSLNSLLFLAGLLIMWNVAFAQVKTTSVRHRWVTGEQFDYQNWAHKGGSDHDHEPGYKQGAMLDWLDGKWRCFSVSSNQWCNTAVYEADTSPSKDPSVIYWTQWRKTDGGNDHWYGVSMNLLPWDEHMEKAKGMQAYLATMTSAKEDKFVYSVARRHFTNTFYASHMIFGLSAGSNKPNGPPGGYEETNLTGRPLGTPPPIDRTSPTKSEPKQAQGNYTRQTLRIRTGLN